VSTVGGHLAQLAVLAEALTDHDTYLVTVPSPQAESALPGIRRYVVRQILRNPAAFLANAVQSLRIFLRERPDVIVTTGAGDALPTTLIAAALGAPVVFVESFARVRRPSLFGRLARRWCDLVLFQWPALEAAYPRGTRVAPLFQFGATVRPPATPALLILTGTHTRGFERLLEAVDSLVQQGRLANRVSAQIGHSRYVPRNYPCFRFLPHDDLMREIDRADVVITHDGSASIGESLSRGRPTVVVPREVAHGEVSYGSEQQLARHLAALGYVVLLEEPSDLPTVLENLRIERAIPPPLDGPDAREVLRGYLARLGPGTATPPRRTAADGESLRIALIAPVRPCES